MKKLEVFDPPMCCSSGVCGPKIDPALPRFAGDLDWLKGQGVDVKRYNLAQQPMVFAGNETVRDTLDKEDVGCLPLILVDGVIVSRASYPSREALASVLGVEHGGALGDRALPELREEHARAGHGGALGDRALPELREENARAGRAGSPSTPHNILPVAHAQAGRAGSPSTPLTRQCE